VELSISLGILHLLLQLITITVIVTLLVKVVSLVYITQS
jgi:hypothetical protein